MPLDDKKLYPSIFLCLSGGGLRATLFHYGCLKRLQEVGLLHHVYALSGTSGGALTAAVLSLTNGKLDVTTGTISYDWDGFESQVLSIAATGLLGLTTLLATAYIFYLLACVTLIGDLFSQLFLPSIGAWYVYISIGAALHLYLAARLLFHRVHTRSEYEKRVFKVMGSGLSRASPIRRYFQMLFIPTLLRIGTMNIHIFKWRLLEYLSAFPKLHMTAVDLNDGQEKIFTNAVIAPLSTNGTSQLWEGRARHDPESSQGVQVAEAVAASTAIPPIFSPVHIVYGRNSGTQFGAFVDGGIVDNLSINVAKAYSTLMRSETWEWKHRNFRSFDNYTRLILILDGSQPLVHRWRIWPWLLSFPRVMDSMINQHREDAKFLVRTFKESMGISAALISLESGVPGVDDAADTKLGDAIRRIRTHLDGFSRKECAALAYCGYALVERYLVENKDNLRDFNGVAYSPPLSLKQILPARCGDWFRSLDDLKLHLTYSNQRSAVIRFLGRYLGNWGRRQ